MRSTFGARHRSLSNENCYIEVQLIPLRRPPHERPAYRLPALRTVERGIDHEIAQVVAASFQKGHRAGEPGTMVKLARVMLLALRANSIRAQPIQSRWCMKRTVCSVVLMDPRPSPIPALAPKAMMFRREGSAWRSGVMVISLFDFVLRRSAPNLGARGGVPPSDRSNWVSRPGISFALETSAVAFISSARRMLPR